ncbi:PepSY domain-containing protein [Marinobacterium lutimaris]|uniref:Sulfite reductase (NADPH) flavoprotein alpha-component n=1 Tax=Marinobacterium lutimaris TaxID=568106 RepID=A0A1H5UY86_9GAMM|nr:PepSY domain-containing protein [Marinobacterium lutimaris]SEF79973.1 sulfite reductase (NADPH) flavoprotein alpha-component [Marinobacterium lutimaris]
MKALLLQLHRWTGLVLLPVFLLVIISGMILALKPVVESGGSVNYQSPADTTQLIAALESMDPEQSIRSLSRAGESAWNLGPKGVVDLKTGEQLPGESSFAAELFELTKSFHKSLLLGLSWLIELATWVMLGIVIVGIFLGWPKFRKTLIGWHHQLGAWLFPLALLLPLTGVMMTQHILETPLPVSPGKHETVKLADALRMADAQADLSELQSARRFKFGSALISTADQTLLVTASDVHVLAPKAISPKTLHEGTWAGAWSGWLNFAVGGLLLGLSVTGFISWYRRRVAGRRVSLTEGAKTLIVYASQTGTAQRLAETTVNCFRRRDIAVDSGGLAAFAPAQWHHYDQVLVLASTTGEGELPENARSWASGLNGNAMAGVKFSLLALGDSRYDAFCGGGMKLRQALLQAGAAELEEPVKVDQAPEKPWRNWLAGLSQRFGWKLDVDGAAVDAVDTGHDAVLVGRKQLDQTQHENCPANYSIELQVPEDVSFKPGDLLMHQPGEGERPRSYSIGSDSSVTPGRIRLSVSLLRYQDEQGKEVLGRASSDLCLNLQPGEQRRVKVAHNERFNPPEDVSTPIILIAAGCGIAPFIGFIEQRAAIENAGPVWVMFGNRFRNGDYLYAQELADWHRSCVISRLDTAFSRDPEDRHYVTDRLREGSADVMEWIEKGARVYICGRASTLGRSADEAFVALLAEHYELDEAAAQQKLDSLVVEGVISRDLFD